MPGNLTWPPPAPELYHPGNLTWTAFERILQFSAGEQPIADVLAKELFGLSRPLQLEIMHRAGVPATLTVATATTELRRRLYDEITAWHWQTTAEPDCLLYLDSSGSPVDFFPYQPRHLPVERLQPAPDLNSAIVATSTSATRTRFFSKNGTS